MTQNKRTYSGRCHCGNVSFDLDSEKNAEDLVPRTCSCSLCRYHGASWISDPLGTATLRFRERRDVSFYRFGHGTADFIICKNCGVLVIALCTIGGSTHAVHNVKSIQDVFAVTPITTNFDGETAEERLSRRAKNWTGRVTILDWKTGENS